MNYDNITMSTRMFWLCLVLGPGCMLPLIWGLPLENNHATTTESRLSAKLQAIIRAVAEREGSNLLDFVLETNAGLGLNLVEGDIQGFNPRHRSAMINPAALWPARTVPYVIESSVGAEVRGYVQEAIEEYHSTTCIQWVPRTTQEDYVVFKSKAGCSSHVGRSVTGGPQDLSLMGPCAKTGTAMHEMMHVLGFFHEHMRPDRDQWVEVLLQNVKAGTEHNFERVPEVLLGTLGLQYDYGSILHYSRHAFSFNGQPTLLPKADPFTTLGQRLGFSSRDVERINRLYRCDLAISDTESTTPDHSSSSEPTDVPDTATHSSADFVTQPAIGWTAWSTWSECNLQCRHFRYRYCVNSDRDLCPGDTQEFGTCASPCQVAVSLGCWALDPSNLAIPAVEGLYPLVNGTYRYRVAAVRRCADVASSLGHAVFAVADGGQCLTSAQAAGTYSTHGPSSDCGSRGEGSATAMNVYSFSTGRVDIDGGWGGWTSWGQCSSSCGGGQKYRYRKCDSPPPVGQGQPCQGRDREVSSCNVDSCQVASHCGEKRHVGTAGTSGYIQVLHYQNYMNCEYVIESGSANVTISVTVTRMDIETSAGCIYDALTIYDGADDRIGQFLGAFCGYGLLAVPSVPALQSSGPALFLRFSSDATGTGEGFTLRFAINANTRKACTKPVKPHHGSFTGSNFVGDTIVFSCDPGYQLEGQSEIRCVDQPGLAVWSDNIPVCLHGHRKRDVSSDTIMRCTFEANLCNFRHKADDRWRWFVATGNNSTPFQPQRPKSDRFGSVDSGFLYAESTRGWHPYDSARATTTIAFPRYVINQTDVIHQNDVNDQNDVIKQGDLSTSPPPSSSSSDHAHHCLCFAYRVHGSDLVYAHLLLQQVGDGEGRGKLVWNAEGEEEDEGEEGGTTHGGGERERWKEVCVELEPRGPVVQVTFEAFLGQKLASSVAVDDLTMTTGQCPAWK